MEKLVRSIARRFWCKNYFERSSKVFHKLRAHFPQVFPPPFSNPVVSKLILPTVRIRRCEVSGKLIGRWLNLSSSAIDCLGVGKRHGGVSRVAYMFIPVSVSESVSSLPSSFLFNFLRLTTLIRSLN